LSQQASDNLDRAVPGEVHVYGLINEAMRRLVTEVAGADAWSRIARRADTVETFAALHYYQDADTYALVAAASAELDVAQDELLRQFGTYWSNRVGPENYADILGATGTSVYSVLHNLDLMHARIQSLYPDLRPPSFAVLEIGPGKLEVHYTSVRVGLAPFVVGLLEGLGQLYGTPATVTHVAPPSAAAPYDVFHVALGG
jgi:hypothetical protein